MDRRVNLEDKYAELEQQTFNLFPERWGDLYRDELLPTTALPPGDIGTAFDGEAEIPVDVHEIDQYYENLNKSRGITGEQAMRYSDPLGNVLGHAEGPSFWRADQQ